MRLLAGLAFWGESGGDIGTSSDVSLLPDSAVAGMENDGEHLALPAQVPQRRREPTA
jgi:hypothetical protein